MAALRLNIPAVFVSGGPMEAGKVKLSTGKAQVVDLIDAMVAAADDKVTDAEVAVIERSACPTCGSCSGMFTANSMNCLTEALGLSLPGNGIVLATHADRKAPVRRGRAPHRRSRAALLRAGRRNARCRAASPRFKAFENAMTLDIAMGGSTNTVLHLLAAAHEGEIDFTMARHRPAVAPRAVSVQGRALGADVHMEDVHRAGGIMAILGELDRAGLLHRERADGARATLGRCADRVGHHAREPERKRARLLHRRRPAACRPRSPSARPRAIARLDLDRADGRHPRRRARLLQGWRPRGAVRQHRRSTAAS